MKAKKTEPKSIRFNRVDLEVAMEKSKLDSVQQLVDLLLSEYVSKPQFNAVASADSKDQSKFKLKDWVRASEDFDGISNSSANF